jgi:hypothetical protein
MTGGSLHLPAIPLPAVSAESIQAIDYNKVVTSRAGFLRDEKAFSPCSQGPASGGGGKRT